MPIAFKEWSVTVRALAEGEQLVTLRKGGIREENKHFELEHERFFLYPTFDHQRNDLVRESHHPELRRALEEGVWPEEEPPPRALLQDGGIPQPDRVRIRAWAEVADHFTTDDPRIVDSLSPYHVWTQDYARKRLRWKRTHPLHVLLLKVHRIPRPVTVRVRDEHIGCHSWVEIDRDLPFEGVPVMATTSSTAPPRRSATPAAPTSRSASRRSPRRRERPALTDRDPAPLPEVLGPRRRRRPAARNRWRRRRGRGADDRTRARGSRPAGGGRRRRLGAIRDRPPPRRTAAARPSRRDRAAGRRRGADRRRRQHPGGRAARGGRRRRPPGPFGRPRRRQRRPGRRR